MERSIISGRPRQKGEDDASGSYCIESTVPSLYDCHVQALHFCQLQVSAQGHSTEDWNLQCVLSLCLVNLWPSNTCSTCIVSTLSPSHPPTHFTAQPT